MHVHFLKAGPLPWASQAIHWAAHFYSAMVCFTPQSAQSTGSVCACACVCVSVGACVCVSERAAWIRQQSLQDQSLSMKSCTICKKCKRKRKKKKTFKAHLSCFYFPYICSLLIVFNDLLFSLVAILIFIMYSFLYIIDRLCVSMWVFHFEVPNVSTVSVRIAFAES